MGMKRSGQTARPVESVKLRIGAQAFSKAAEERRALDRVLHSGNTPRENTEWQFIRPGAGEKLGIERLRNRFSVPPWRFGAQLHVSDDR
jgi:hypothetical protein